jgi:serine/threonine protein phosphatase PrpC
MKAMKLPVEGRPGGLIPIEFMVTDPLFSFSRLVTVGGRNIWMSACVLPGMDTHMTQEKQCQDMCFFETDGDSLICGLFDGHGPNGKAVVNFCKKTASQYYAANKKEYTENAEIFLQNLTRKCDGDMKISANGVDSTGSGS